jgi:hypothetical protein
MPAALPSAPVDERQLKVLIVLPHCGMLPKVSLKNVTEPIDLVPFNYLTWPHFDNE